MRILTKLFKNVVQDKGPLLLRRDKYIKSQMHVKMREKKEILKEVSLKRIQFIMLIMRLENFPDQWKVAQTIMIGKPSEN